MFASVELAARIDRAETRLTDAVVRAVMAAAPAVRAFVEPIAGGVAAYAGPGSPMSKMIGIGFEHAPDAERLEAIEALFAERAAPLQAEVATLARPETCVVLTRRGYVLQNFENVSGRPIVEADRNPPRASGMRLELMTDAQVDAWVDAAITGFQHPDAAGVSAPELPPREALEVALRPFATAPGFHRYCAWIDGAAAGVATLRIDDGIAQLCGATTLPPFRRRGVQAALLQRRLADSADVGCDLAVLTTQPGSTSQANGLRQGFALLYARAVLVKA